VSLYGPLIEKLAETGARVATMSPSLTTRLAAELAAFARGEGDELAIAELLAELAEPTETRDPELVEAIAHVVRLDFASSTSLSALAERAGYSLFHACRT